MNMDFKSAEELLNLCEENQLPISEVMRQRECLLGEVPRDSVNHRMGKAWEIMRSSATQPLKKPIKSMGGLIGGEAKKLEAHDAKNKSICGDVLEKAITYAMAVLEVNASMGLIVAAPTAGSAGVVPGMMLALQECYRISDQRIVDALFNAGAVGYLAMRNATVAGAVGGCQAEVGVASAMAASAAVEPGCSFHCAHEHAGPCVRPRGRPGGVPLPESQRCRCGQCPRCSGTVPERDPPADPL